MGGYRTAHSYVQPFVGFFAIGAGGGRRETGGQRICRRIGNRICGRHVRSQELYRIGDRCVCRDRDSNPGLRPFNPGDNFPRALR